MIHNLRLKVLDLSRRVAILYDLGKIHFLLRNNVKFRKILKIYSLEIFRAESWQ